MTPQQKLLLFVRKKRRNYFISFGLVVKWSLSDMIILTVKLTSLYIAPEHYTIDPLVMLGLKPDSSKNHQQITFSCLLAWNYISMSKRKETAPKVEGSLNIYHQSAVWRPIQKVLFPKSGNF